MSAAPAVLLAVAKELAEQAKASMPEIRSGESVLREWYENGRYHRETEFNGEILHFQYDFRQRKSRQVAVVTK